MGGFAITQVNPHQDAIQALISLGIQKAIAKTIQVEGDQSGLETLIKAALKNC